MSQVADLYKVLGVPENADADAVKKAYRALAKKLHPDANPGDKKSEERFKELGQAYEILSDPEKRRRYDALRRAPYADDARPGPGGAGGPFGGGGVEWQGAGSIDELFSMFFGQGGPGGGFDPRSGQGSFGGFGTAGPDMGADLDSEVWVSFEDAALGRPVTVQMEGQAQPLRLNLPPGAESGLRLRLAGQGAPRRRGRRGDLYLTLKVKPSERFTRQGLDVTGTVTVNLAQALLGSKATAATLRGDLRVSIPAGTQPGTRLRLAGQGIEAEGRRGDHYAQVEVRLPLNLSDDEKAQISAMAKRRDWDL